MHPRNPYSIPLDFIALAESYTPLTPFLVRIADGTVTLNFKDAETQRRLTEALLHRDFGLSLSLPEGRLCPPVPNRLNYLLWIQDVLSATARYHPLDEVTGIDIGTGASAIYPLLGCKLEPTWKFAGTEIDDASYASAVRNVDANALGARIRVVRVSPSDRILAPLYAYPDTKFAFTMCNPPFYGSAAEVARSAEGKALEPAAVCTGADVEMITPGGEAAFVARMVEESVLSGEIGERCLWFTSMLGKLSSLSTVVSLLRERNIDNYALAELVQGQTRRWVVAWSFADVRLPDSVARALPAVHHAHLPMPNTLRQPLASLLLGSPDSRRDDLALRDVREALLIVLRALDGVAVSVGGGESGASTGAGGDQDVELDDGEGRDGRGGGAEWFMVDVRAERDTWSRKARRRQNQNQKRHGAAESEMAIDDGPPPPNTNILPLSIALVVEIEPNTAERLQLECTWRRGRERALFEGFWGHVCRKLWPALVDRPRP